MKVNVLLADKGTSSPAHGTLNLLNAGWTQTQLTGSPVPNAPGLSLTPPHAVAVFYEVEPAFCNKAIELVVELVTQDGETVQLPGPAGPQAMRLQQQITVETPGGVPIGTPGTGNRLIEIFPCLPLAPGIYEWRVSLAGQHQTDWHARFHVAGPPGPPTFGFSQGG